MSYSEKSELLMRMARMPVHRDRNLTVGAKYFFGTITTFCHSEEHGGNDAGVWTISQKKLSALLDVSPRTLTSWTRELVSAGYITVGKCNLPDHYPINTYTVNHTKN